MNPFGIEEVGIEGGPDGIVTGDVVVPELPELPELPEDWPLDKLPAEPGPVTFAPGWNSSDKKV